MKRGKLVFALTTCRSPSRRTRSFIKDLVLSLPGVIKINRGKKKIGEVFYEASLINAKYVVFIYEWKGNPRLMRIYGLNHYYAPKVTDNVFGKHVADLKISGLKLSREVQGYRRVYNVEKISVLYDGCYSDQCFTLSELFEKIYKDLIDENPDVNLVFYDTEDVVTLEFRSRLNKPCGPIIKFSEVKVY